MRNKTYKLPKSIRQNEFKSCKGIIAAMQNKTCKNKE